jgi:hypothetical protein
MQLVQRTSNGNQDCPASSSLQSESDAHGLSAI